MVLTPAAVKRYYDRSGTFQDRQAFYEDRALEALVRHAAFEEATSIVELGCGTGRLARRLLTRLSAARYDGFDVSTTMLGIARDRLASLNDRARLHLLEPGTIHLPIPDHSADRLVSTYVLDLLSPADIRTVVEEAHRVLRPGGRLCLASLTTGPSTLPRIVARLWSVVFRLRPQLVGGCRPIELGPYCAEAEWDILHREVVVRWGLSSEVLVARPRVTGYAPDAGADADGRQ
jgi:ubiquinone/menaquinone biosynthesis C-methylase UbiE